MSNLIGDSKITRTHEIEVGANEYMAEIKFDCLVTMYDAMRLQLKGGILSGKDYQSLPPQWFKLQNKITLEGIKYTDPYALGMLLKEMLNQLEDHIEQNKRNL